MSIFFLTTFKWKADDCTRNHKKCPCDEQNKGFCVNFSMKIWIILLLSWKVRRSGNLSPCFSSGEWKIASGATPSTLSGGCKVLIEHSNASTSSFFRRCVRFIQIHVQEAAAAITAANPRSSNWFIVSLQARAPSRLGTIWNYDPLCIDLPISHTLRHTRLFDKPLSIRKQAIICDLCWKLAHPQFLLLFRSLRVRGWNFISAMRSAPSVFHFFPLCLFCFRVARRSAHCFVEMKGNQ